MELMLKAERIWDQMTVTQTTDLTTALVMVFTPVLTCAL